MSASYTAWEVEVWESDENASGDLSTQWTCVTTPLLRVCFCRRVFISFEGILRGTCNKTRHDRLLRTRSGGDGEKYLTGSRHPNAELHLWSPLMWMALWRTNTLLLFTVPGALQGILGPEGKPVPGFMRGMSLLQKYCGGHRRMRVTFSCFVGKLSEGKVWEEPFCSQNQPC